MKNVFTKWFILTAALAAASLLGTILGIVLDNDCAGIFFAISTMIFSAAASLLGLCYVSERWDIQRTKEEQEGKDEGKMLGKSQTA